MSIAIDTHAQAGTVPIPHVAREFNKYPNSAYILPADEKEAERLQLQHDVLKEAYGGKILLCPFEEQGSYFVLDSGVGCGSWILDIASQLSPSSILHCVDIESRLLPRAHSRNVSFSLNSVLTLPSEWAGKFDIVHQRLLYAALRRTEWPQALTQIFRVLRPGGWVQLGEYGSWDVGPATARFSLLHRELYVSRGLDREITRDLPALLLAAGFSDVHVERRMIPLGSWAGKLGVDGRDNIIEVFRAMKTAVLQAGGFGLVATEDEFDKLVDALEKEWDETEGAGVEFLVFYAQRPTVAH